MDYKIKLGLLGGGLAGGWVTYRLLERRKLTKLLEEDPTVQSIIAQGLVDWSPSEKAAEVIGFFDTTSASKAFGQVIATLPVPPEKMIETASRIGGEAAEALDAALGLPPGTTVNAAQVAASTAWDLLPSLPTLPGV